MLPPVPSECSIQGTTLSPTLQPPAMPSESDDLTASWHVDALLRLRRLHLGGLQG
eukprot:COSAG02_NODE_51614_length_313_cov_0.691589_1_plen_54_part_01